MLRTRFAPSPTGPLHLGHAFSALTADRIAHAAQGDCLLRIEDLDTARCRPEWEAQIFADLAWLGLRWPEPVLRQSQEIPRYRQALDRLGARGLLYPCACTRGDIRRALSAPQEGAPQGGPDGPIYPGTCRHRAYDDRRPEDALRLDIRKALDSIDKAMEYDETGAGVCHRIAVRPEQLISGVGDVVLGRRETGQIAYHLACVLDDAHQNITHVVRGEDLAPATQIHVVLQALLDLPVPVYHHHRLIRDEDGKRLSKRDDARAIATYRAEGLTPGDVRALVGLPPEAG